MLVLFFTIIFLAELIVAYWIISNITALNKNVCALNQKVLEFKPQIKGVFTNLRAELAKVLLGLDKFVEFISCQGENCKKYFQKTLLTKILLAILKIPAKRIAAIIDLVLIAKNIFKK